MIHTLEYIIQIYATYSQDTICKCLLIMNMFSLHSFITSPSKTPTVFCFHGYFHAYSNTVKLYFVQFSQQVYIYIFLMVQSSILNKKYNKPSLATKQNLLSCSLRLSPVLWNICWFAWPIQHCVDCWFTSSTE